MSKIKKPLLSLLVTLFSGRDEQFERSLSSLTSYKFDPEKVEILVFMDYPDYNTSLKILNKFAKHFVSVRAFVIIKKDSPVNHSASRRNFLVTQAKGDYIVFCEPEMLHLSSTIDHLISHIAPLCKNKWVCGPVYATGDIVSAKGELVDSLRPLKNMQKILEITKRQNLLKNKSFNRNYHRISYKYYKSPFYCAMFNKEYFLKLGGLNQNLKVRGYEESDLYQRFIKSGGKVIVDNRIKTVHLPHPRIIDIESQVSWNLYNSTVTFDHSQNIGKIADAKFKVINLK